MSFTTPLFLCGPLRQPLAEQEYGGHASIHDDAMAEKLDFRAGIEGPTHFSLFAPMQAHLWGRAWFEHGCLSALYQNMVVEGESARAFVRMPAAVETRTDAWAEKADGTPGLEASASLGLDDAPTLLAQPVAAHLCRCAACRGGAFGTDAPPYRRRASEAEVSHAIDRVAADGRLAPLLRLDAVGVFGGSAGGHTALSLAGGQWSPSRFRDHCLRNIEQDFFVIAETSFLEDWIEPSALLTRMLYACPNQIKSNQINSTTTG
jgi:hypothetical protein